MENEEEEQGEQEERPVVKLPSGYHPRGWLHKTCGVKLVNLDNGDWENVVVWCFRLKTFGPWYYEVPEGFSEKEPIPEVQTSPRRGLPCMIALLVLVGVALVLVVFWVFVTHYPSSNGGQHQAKTPTATLAVTSAQCSGAFVLYGKTYNVGLSPQGNALVHYSIEIRGKLPPNFQRRELDLVVYPKYLNSSYVADGEGDKFPVHVTLTGCQ